MHDFLVQLQIYKPNLSRQEKNWLIICSSTLIVRATRILRN